MTTLEHEIIGHYCRAIDQAFAEISQMYGFKKFEQNRHAFGFSINFTCTDRYFNISGSLHPHDYPYETAVILGETGTIIPAQKYNFVPLNFICKDEIETFSSLSFISNEADGAKIQQKIDGMKALLEKYALHFLMGDLSDFFEVRAKWWQQSKS